jgi:hypothetical protein
MIWNQWLTASLSPSYLKENWNPVRFPELKLELKPEI